jgi:pilus assembly protein CpaD
MIKTLFDRRLAAVMMSASAAACANFTTPPKDLIHSPVSTTADLHKITVAQSGERLEVPVAGADGAITPETAALIDSFGRSYRDIGHGPLIVSTPAGAGDANAAARLAQATRVELAEGGVPYAAIAGSTYDAGGKPTAPVVLSFTRFTAEAPVCDPVWTVDLSKSADNRAPKTFGCFVNANLAGMIADPADLNGPRDIDPRDGARRAVVMDKYRQGEPTGATRSEAEQVKISDAVK